MKNYFVWYHNPDLRYKFFLGFLHDYSPLGL